MKSMLRTWNSIFIVAGCLSLSACWAEPVPLKLDDEIRKLSSEDRDRFQDALESIGRSENAIRVLTQYGPPAVVPARTQKLAKQLARDVCQVSVTETAEKWGPANVFLSVTGPNCELSSDIQRTTQTEGVHQNLTMNFERRFTEAQKVTEAREVQLFTAYGSRLRTPVTKTPVATEQRRQSITGQGFLLNGDRVRISVTEERRQVFGKGTYENRKRRLLLTLKDQVYLLEGTEEPNRLPDFKLNGEPIPPIIFEDYFSKLGFIGDLSSLTDAG
jgi:hypothetical protein